MGIEAIVGKHVCFLFCAAFCRSGHAMQVSVQCDSTDLASAPYPSHHLSGTGKTFAATSLVTPHAQYAYSHDKITSLAAKHMQPDAEEAVLPTIRKTPSQQEFNKCLQDEHSHQVDDEHSKQRIQEYLEGKSENNEKDGIGMKSATESGPGEERILTRLNANGERPTDVDGVGTDVEGAVAEVDGVLANDDGAEVYQKFYQHGLYKPVEEYQAGVRDSPTEQLLQSMINGDDDVPGIKRSPKRYNLQKRVHFVFNEIETPAQKEC